MAGQHFRVFDITYPGTSQGDTGARSLICISPLLVLVHKQAYDTDRSVGYEQERSRSTLQSQPQVLGCYSTISLSLDSYYTQGRAGSTLDTDAYTGERRPPLRQRGRRVCG